MQSRDETILRVVVPPHASPGETLRMPLPGSGAGHRVEVVVPEGLSAGDEFEVEVSTPPLSGAPPPSGGSPLSPGREARMLRTAEELESSFANAAGPGSGQRSAKRGKRLDFSGGL